MSTITYISEMKGTEHDSKFYNLIRNLALWRQNEHGDPHLLLPFYHLLDLLHQYTKFHLQSMLGSFTRESP